MSVPPAPPRLDPERLRRARAYRKFRLWSSIASTVVAIAVMVALHLAGVGIAVRDATRPLASPLSVYGVIAVFFVVGWIVLLPFAYATWARGRREGLVVQSMASAFADELKALALTLTLIGLPLTGWFLVLPRDDWWLITVAGTAVLSALGFLIGPAIAALFFRFERLTDADTAARVRAVAERAGVPVSGVYRWDLGAKTTAANAAVMGLGPTKRIALGDTLLAKFLPDEVDAVVAHEVGHVVMRDTLRYVVATTIVGAATLIGVRLLVDVITSGTPVAGTADVASYPLVAAVFQALAFAGRPAFMTFSRSRERVADAFGARCTAPRTMARALVRLADQNLADPEPPRWEEVFFYSHPAVANRVRALGLRWEELMSAS